jgi:hypothetical protein
MNHRIRPLTAQEETRVDSLCLGPAHNQIHSKWDPVALRRLLDTAPPCNGHGFWQPLINLWNELRGQK